MRYFLVVVAAIALAAPAFAGVNTGKIVKTKIAAPGVGRQFDAVVNDDAGNPLASISCSKLDTEKGDVKIYWLDPEHMPQGDAPLAFTWGDKIENGTVEQNVVGLMQLQNFYPDGQATFTMKVVFVGHVANRLKMGVIKAADIVPVANTPGEWGSVVNTSGVKGKIEKGITAPKYLDLTEYGAKVEVDTTNYEATFSWTYEPAKGFVVMDGQLDIGLMVVHR